jgi:hypothetical protein
MREMKPGHNWLGEPFDVDLGGGHGVNWLLDAYGVRTGGHWQHPPGPTARDDVKEEGFCLGGFTITGPNPWKLEKEDPLTLSPSLLCMSCGSHIFIRDGKVIQT